MSGTTTRSGSGQPPSVRCALVILAELLGGGVRHVVCSPGSRSAPLALVMAQAEREGKLTLHVVLDERSAGFRALGLSLADRRPVAVITTSGTAAANLHPAVLEAHHAGVPLVVITADRPATMIDIGANQTTRQVGLFNAAIRDEALINSADDHPRSWATTLRRLLVAAAGVRSRDPGPVHLNLRLAAPLVPHGPVNLASPQHDTLAVEAAIGPAETTLPAAPGTVLIAGAGAGTWPAMLAERAGLPLFAEPSSGSRHGPAAIATYRLLLESSLAADIERVIVFGRPTLSRPVQSLLGSAPELIMVSTSPRWIDPGWNADRVLWGVSEIAAGGEWLGQWQQADLVVGARVAEIAGPWGGLTIARTVMAAGLGPVVLGSSNPIRDCDLAPIGTRRAIFANRGLAGIDGSISTARGVALATAEPTHALLGDLTFLHDLTGLLTTRGERPPDLRIVVANDSGGSIFAGLEQGAAAFSADFERVFATPQQADLRHLAEGVGASYRAVRDTAELGAALADPPGGIEVVDARIERGDRREQGEELRAAARRL